MTWPGALTLIMLTLLVLRGIHRENRLLRLLLLEMSKTRGWMGVEDVRELVDWFVPERLFDLVARQLEAEGELESRPWPRLIGRGRDLGQARKYRRRDAGGR